jgi:hypothetical protein
MHEPRHDEPCAARYVETEVEVAIADRGELAPSSINGPATRPPLGCPVIA